MNTSELVTRNEIKIEINRTHYGVATAGLGGAPAAPECKVSTSALRFASVLARNVVLTRVDSQTGGWGVRASRRQDRRRGVG